MTEERRPVRLDPDEPQIRASSPEDDPLRNPPGNLSIDPDAIMRKPRPDDIEEDPSTPDESA